MGKKEDECRRHRENLERSKQRLKELEERGAEALSVYDRTIAFRNDEEALRVSKWLVQNHVNYDQARVDECDGIPRQATLFEL